MQPATDLANYEIDLGPGLGFATLKEYPAKDEEDEMNEILKDLKGIRDIMLDFGVITTQQGEQLGTVTESVSTVKDNTESGVQELVKAHEYTDQRRQRFMRTTAILGGGGIGTAGFLINPAIGIAAIAAGGGLGWFLTRKRTVDTILRIPREN